MGKSNYLLYGSVSLLGAVGSIYLIGLYKKKYCDNEEDNEKISKEVTVKKSQIKGKDLRHTKLYVILKEDEYKDIKEGDNVKKDGTFFEIYELHNITHFTKSINKEDYENYHINEIRVNDEDIIDVKIYSYQVKRITITLDYWEQIPHNTLLSNYLLANETLASEIILKNPNMIEFLSPTFRNYRTLALECMGTGDESIIDLIPLSFRNQDIYEKYILSHPKCIDKIPKEFITENVYKKQLSDDYYTYMQKIPEEKLTKNLCFVALEEEDKYYESLNFIKSFITNIKRYPIMKFIPDKFKTITLCKYAISLRSDALKYISPNNLLPDSNYNGYFDKNHQYEELCYIAILSDPTSIHYILYDHVTLDMAQMVYDMTGILDIIPLQYKSSIRQNPSIKLYR